MINENQSSKPTPGPWSFEMVRHQPIQKEFGAYLLTDAAGHNIALISTWMDTPASAEEAHANAVLISASRDLLEALEKVVTRLEANLDDDREMGRGSMTYLLEVCAPAIARARGLSK